MGKGKIDNTENGRPSKRDEWKDLRDENARKQQLSYQIFFSVVGLNFLLYSYILVQKEEHHWMDAFIALLPAFIVGIAHFWHLKNVHSGKRITLYIRHFIETDKLSSFNWETAVKKLISPALDKKRKEIRKEPRKLKKSWKYLKGVFCYFTGIPLLRGNSGKIPKEVSLVLYPFYYISPLISAFIGILVTEWPKIFPKCIYGNFFWIFLIFLLFSFVIYLFWMLLFIGMMEREIEVLSKVSDEIDQKGLEAWKEEIEQWVLSEKKLLQELIF